jgi:hypothetical protein
MSDRLKVVFAILILAGVLAFCFWLWGTHEPLGGHAPLTRPVPQLSPNP